MINVLNPKTCFISGISKQTGNLKTFDNEEYLPKFIELQDGTYTRLRCTQAVLRVHASKRKQGHEELYAEMLLSLPWRDELADIHSTVVKCIEQYKSNEKVMKTNRLKIYPHSEAIDIMKMILKSGNEERSSHIVDTTDAVGQQENLDDAKELEPPDLTELPEELLPKNKDQSKFIPIDVSDKEELVELVKNMSFEQRIGFDKIMNYCKEVVTPKPENVLILILMHPQIIVHDGGGVGKSYLIKTVAKWAEYTLRKGQDPEQQPQILLLWSNRCSFQKYWEQLFTQPCISILAISTIKLVALHWKKLVSSVNIYNWSLLMKFL